MRKIEFVDYTGKFPNLCYGNLTLKIDEKEYTFGSRDGARYPMFWVSGGAIRFFDNWDYIVEEGPWKFNYDEMPNWLTFEEKCYICELFRENVDKGCCGGCV